MEDPGYQFRLSEGEKGINRGLAARGGFDSGAAMKALNRYNSDLASQEYGASYDRFNTDNNNLYNRLAGLSNTGLGATNTGVQVGQNSANQYGSIYGALGSANIASAANSSNQKNQALAGLFGGGQSSYMNSNSALGSLVPQNNRLYQGFNSNTFRPVWG
jgi:hypothetical protein